jgi:hypothetical protein
LLLAWGYYKVFNKVKKDGLLFDKNDVIEALGVFLQQFNNNQLNSMTSLI